MKMATTLIITIALWAIAASHAQTPAAGQKRQNADVATGPRLKKFDKDGDGKISDSERQAIRQFIRQRGARAGSVTPSTTVETAGNREVTQLEYASSDGRKIPAVLSMPKGDGPFPVVVTIHGGQGNRDFAFIRTLAAPGNISPTVNMLNQQPWAILAISYRAGGGAFLGMDEDDVVAGIRFAKTLPKIDPARVGVLGGSHGGHLALRAAEVMGKEFLCVAVGSPWMTNPRVYLHGKPDEPPLSQVPPKARDGIIENGKRLLRGLQHNRGMSAEELEQRIAAHSIEENAEKIVVPSLFLTSLGDEQAPHVMVQPTIARLKAVGRDVTVCTAEKSPHGFYWGRDVGGARIGRGEKSPDELAEEAAARGQIFSFFGKWFGEKQQAARLEPQSKAGQMTSPSRPLSGARQPAPAAPSRPSRTLFQRISNGINTDFAPTQAVPNKVLYDPAYFDAVRSAGFESVRFFINYTATPGIYAQIVKDAIDKGLVVVLCMWARNTGQEEFVNAWDAIARYYKDYPDSLVFELFNEPLGSKVSDRNTVLQWCNAAIPAIRKTSAARTIIIGGPDWNQAEMLRYLTPEYFTYRLPDGTGFAEDKHIIGACHYYLPMPFTHSNGVLTSLSKYPRWKEDVTKSLDLLFQWAKAWQKPLVMTEWGAQTVLKVRSELLEYIGFMFAEMRKRNIGSIYYCGPFSNEWGFSIFDSEWGWDQDILDILTGVKGPPPPPANPLLNPEFYGTARWTVSADSQVSVTTGAGLSGTHALKIALPDGAARAVIFQETHYKVSVNNDTLRYSNKYLLHLRKGSTYRLSFLARAERPGATIQARFENAKGAGPVYWTSNPATVETSNKEYTMSYTHAGDDVQDMRVTIIFEGSNNTVYFDRIALKSTRPLSARF